MPEPLVVGETKWGAFVAGVVTVLIALLAGGFIIALVEIFTS